MAQLLPGLLPLTIEFLTVIVEPGGDKAVTSARMPVVFPARCYADVTTPRCAVMAAPTTPPGIVLPLIVELVMSRVFPCV